MEFQKATRRSFFGGVLAFFGISTLAAAAKTTTATKPAVATPKAAPAKKAPAKKTETVKWVSEKDPVANALKYKHDKKDVDKKLLKKKMGVEAKDQFCDNCIQYVKGADSYGTCKILVNKGNVKAKAWCNMWTKK